MTSSIGRLSDTSRAFDAHAAHYDAAVEPNELLFRMRSALWAEVARRVPPPARLLDLGCGTGIDAVHFAEGGYRVTAVDASHEMVNQTRRRVERASVKVRTEHTGAQELGVLGDGTFDAIYSDLGPLNCVPDLRAVSAQCAAHLAPGGFLIVSAMARICPWEIAYYALRGDRKQASRRLTRAMVPVNLEQGTVWTRYYSPREFYEPFANDFRLGGYRSLNLFLPPPYLHRWYERARRPARSLAWMDAHLHSLPLLRDMGDHFLMVLIK